MNLSLKWNNNAIIPFIKLVDEMKYNQNISFYQITNDLSDTTTKYRPYN